MALISAPDVAPIPPAAGQGRVLGPSARFAVSRVLSSLGTLVFVILFNFFLFRMLPGDPIALYTRGRDVDPEIRRQMQAKFHAPIFDDNAGDSTAKACADHSKARQQNATNLEQVFRNS